MSTSVGALRSKHGAATECRPYRKTTPTEHFDQPIDKSFYLELV